MPFAEEGMDTDLVIQARNGDKGAFATLAAARADRFLATSHRIVMTSPAVRISTRTARSSSASGSTSSRFACQGESRGLRAAALPLKIAKARRRISDTSSA